jgi:hypothetical protein
LFFSSRPETRPKIIRGITIESMKTINHINYSISSNAFPVFSFLSGFSISLIIAYRGVDGKTGNAKVATEFVKGEGKENEQLRVKNEQMEERAIFSFFIFHFSFVRGKQCE